MHNELLHPFQLAIENDLLRINFIDEENQTRFNVEFKDYLFYQPSIEPEDKRFKRSLVCWRSIPKNLEWLKYDLYIQQMINEIILVLVYKLQWFAQDIHAIDKEYILTKKPII